MIVETKCKQAVRKIGRTYHFCLRIIICSRSYSATPVSYQLVGRWTKCYVAEILVADDTTGEGRTQVIHSLTSRQLFLFSVSPYGLQWASQHELREWRWGHVDVGWRRPQCFEQEVTTEEGAWWVVVVTCLRNLRGQFLGHSVPRCAWHCHLLQMMYIMLRRLSVYY